MAVTAGVVADVRWLVGELCASGAHTQHTHVSLSRGTTPSLKTWLRHRGALPAGLGPGEPRPRAEPPPALLQALSAQRDARKRTPLLFTAHGYLLPALISSKAFLFHFFITFRLLLEFPEGPGQVDRE